MLARSEGTCSTRVYSGKGMAGLIDLIRKGHLAQGANVVFLHTGGAVGCTATCTRSPRTQA